MFEHFNLQEINQLRKKIEVSSKVHENTLYNQLMIGKTSGLDLKNIHFDTFENTDKSNMELTNMKIEDGSLIVNIQQQTFDENGYTLEELSDFQNPKLVKSGTMFCLYEERDGFIHSLFIQNGVILRTLEVFEGIHPSFIKRADNTFLVVYNKTVNGLKKIFYREINLNGWLSLEEQLDPLNTSHNNENPVPFLSPNGDVHIVFVSDKNGVKNIVYWNRIEFIDITSKRTICENPAAAVLDEKVFITYEDNEYGFTQICYRTSDDFTIENRITTPNKIQKEPKILPFEDKLVLLSLSNMNNVYLDFWKTDLTVDGFTNQQITTSPSDVSEVNFTVNGEGRETFFWISNGLLSVLYGTTTENLGDYKSYVVGAGENQELFLVGESFFYKEIDTLERVEGVLYSYTPITQSQYLTYSIPMESENLDVYLTLVGEEYEVIPYICDGHQISRQIQMVEIETVRKGDTLEKHFQLKRNMFKQIVIKLEVKSSTRYPLTKIIDFGLTYY